MIRPIIIAPTYLDPHCAVGQIERHFFENLSDISPIIVCKPGDSSLVKKCQCVEVKENRFFHLLERILRNLGLRDLLQTPDYMRYSWGRRALKRCAEILKHEQIAYIHTINMPCSSHWVGLKLKRKTGLPWIAQFYDPWRNNPTRRFKFSVLDKFDANLEKAVSSNANLIFHSNQLMIKDWTDAYGEAVSEKMHILPYVTQAEITGGEKPENSRFTITHIGSFQQFRESSTFIKAVKLMVDQHPETRDKFVVKYVGRVTEPEQELIKSYGLNDSFSFEGYKTEEECFPYFKEADLFLAIDTKHPHNIFFPSKLLKYFFFRKPILGIVQKESVLREELLMSKNFVFDYFDSDNISKFLYEAICDKSAINRNDKTYWKKFSIDEVLPAYQQLIKRL